MFKAARKKLTISYLLVIMLLTLTVSALFYIGLNKNIDRALNMHQRRVDVMRQNSPRFRELPLNFQDPFTKDAISDVRINTIYFLIVINVSIWMVSGTFAYWFAGRTLKPIEIMTERQKKFIADAAHELKTPITSMKTQIEVSLRDKDFDVGEGRRILGSILEDINAFSTLVQSLLTQSRYQESASPKKELANLKDLINESTKKFDSRISKKEIVLNKNLGDVNYYCDKKAILELLSILIDNAIKFNKQKGEINIKLLKLDSNAVIEVSDNGIGISESDQKNIFNRFFKSDSSRTKNNDKGYGLGLSIAKDIVTQHGGNISVKSDIGKGSTFIVTLPL